MKKGKQGGLAAALQYPLRYGKKKGGAAYREKEDGQTDDEPAHGADQREII
jgi:hypothetical protein